MVNTVKYFGYRSINESITDNIFSATLFFFFFAMPSGLEDLSSLTRDWIQAVGSESTQSSPLDHQRIPNMFLLSFKIEELRVRFLLTAKTL